jgi:gliding motility-associated-like protein/uncharacterized delta-60 repeat protein
MVFLGKKSLLQFAFYSAVLFTPFFTIGQTPALDWVQQFGSAGNELIQGMVRDASGNIYLSGGFTGTIDFDPGPGVSNMTSAGQRDIFVVKMDAVGNFVWAFRTGGTDSESASALSVDGSGNVYVAGSYAFAFDFDPGAGVVNLGAVNSDDIFIVKLDASGNFSWAKKVGGSSTDLVGDIAISSSGDIWLTGGFRSTVDFDPGTGISNLTAAALYDIYILRLDQDGNFLSVGHVSGSGSEIALSIDIDPTGNLLLTGNFQVTVDFDPGPGVFTMAPFGGNDNTFILKLNSFGGFLWAKQPGGSGGSSGSSITADADGNIYATGNFQGTLDFDPNSGVVNMTSAGDRDIFVVKLDPSGQLVWARRMGGTLADNGNSIDVDGSNNVYVLGNFFGTADFDPGAGTYALSPVGQDDFFMVKLDPSSNLIFASGIGGTGRDYTNNSVVTPTGDIYIAGIFSNVVDFDPGVGITNLTTAGGDDIFFTKIVQTASSGPTITNFTPGNGMVGATVTITGTNFSSIPSNNIVEINGIVAVVSVSSLNSLTVAVPSGATTGPISVTVGGVTATSATDFNVVPTPVISITTQPMDVEVCPNGTGTLTVAATGTTNLTYRWQKYNSTASAFIDLTNGTGYSGVTTTSLDIDFEAGAVPGEYHVRINGDFAAEAISNDVMVTQRTPPASPMVSPVNGIGDCGPVEITLTATSSTPGEFRWYMPQNRNFPFLANTDGTFTTPRLSAPSMYYVSFFDGACESAQVSLTASVTYEGPGALDPTLNPPANGDGSISFIDQIVVQPDKKFFMNHYEVANEEYQLFRMNPDGSADGTFNPLNRDLFNGRVDVLALQADGKIVIGGRFTQIDGNSLGRIARVNSGGTLDLSFNVSGSGFNNAVRGMAVQTDGKLIVVGSFTTYNGTPVTRIVRLNADGSIDGSFNVGTGPNNSLNGIKLQPDNKIVVSGSFTAFNGTSLAGMARLNIDGSVDLSFSPPAGINPIAICIQSDDKILVGGAFTTVDGASRNYIARLNSNGSHDLSFDPGTGFDDWVYSLYQEPSGKIVVGGWFENFNGQTRNFIARLNPNGSLDNFFDPGIGPYSLVTSIIPYGLNRILIGGYIDQWNGNLHNAVGLVNNECIRTPTGFDNTTCDGDVILTACGGLDGQYRWYTQPSGGGEISGEVNGSLSVSGLAATTAFYVSLKDDVCESARVPVVATFTSSISAPVATGGSSCTANSVSLSASGAANGEYRWYTVAVGGSPIAGETNSSFTTPALSATATYYVSINNGSCESARVPVVATIQSSPAAPSVVPGSVCGAGVVTLHANGGANGQYRWYITATGGSPINGEVNSIFTTPSLNSTTSYFVSIHNGACEGPRAEIVASVTTIPLAPVANGTTVCANTSATLSASGSTDGNYRWYSGGHTLIPNQFNHTLITPPISAGTSYFVSVVADGCESVLTEVVVNVNSCSVNVPPTISATTLVTQIGGVITLDLLSLIDDVDGNIDVGSLTVLSQPSSGASAMINNGELTLDYTGTSFSGMDQLTVQVCDDENSCSEAVISIEVIGDVIVYNAISPNGDGLNDILRIQYIEIIEETKMNKVTIFNRWGDRVFEVNDYDNLNRVFNGTSDNGKELPTGTYFYSIRFASGRESKTGYLYLNR